MREQFEKLPEIRDSISEHIVFIGNKYTTPNPDFYDLVNWLNGAWYAWQAKAQAVQEISASIAVHQIIIDEIKTEIDEGYDLRQDSYLLDVLVERGIEIGKIQAVQEGLRKSQEKVKVYELHVKTLKQIHENEFNEKSESSYILGNLDGFFECLESDLGEIK